ncbi:MAG: TetR/AcrR family transcriptional regulator [Rubrobacter sp.]
MDARYKTGAERKTAEERREAVLRAAMAEFAARGLHGASTERVAREAGIAHSYVFKLFGTKKDLFLASTERVYDRILGLFREGVRRHPEAPIWGMGDSFRELLEQREELLVVVHGFAAAGDPEIGGVVRERSADLYRYASDASGAEAARLQAFWSYGMMLIVAAAIDLPSLQGKEGWVYGLLNREEPSNTRS